MPKDRNKHNNIKYFSRNGVLFVKLVFPTLAERDIFAAVKWAIVLRGSVLLC